MYFLITFEINELNKNYLYSLQVKIAQVKSTEKIYKENDDDVVTENNCRASCMGDSPTQKRQDSLRRLYRDDKKKKKQFKSLRFVLFLILI